MEQISKKKSEEKVEERKNLPNPTVKKKEQPLQQNRRAYGIWLEVLIW